MQESDKSKNISVRPTTHTPLDTTCVFDPEIRDGQEPFVHDTDVLKHILQVNNNGKDTIDNNDKEAPAGPSDVPPPQAGLWKV